MQLEDYNDIVQYWVDCVMRSRGRDAEQTLRCCNDIIAYGVKGGDCHLIGFGHYYMGETYYCLNDGNNFFDSVSKAIPYLERACEWELMARCYNLLGIWAMNRGNAPIAQDYYLSGISYCRKYHLKKMEVQISINIGALNIQCGRYEDALNYLEQVLSYMKQETGDEEYHGLMVSTYQNMIKCLIPQGENERIEDILQHIYKDHWDAVGDLEKVTVLCTEAVYYNTIHKLEKRDHCIGLVQSGIPENVAILDMFDDLYDYASMLLENDKQEEFWKLIEIMEPLIRSCSIIKMQLRLISLKIRFYRKHEQNAEYLQAAGLYYELSELMETETRTMMNNILSLRRSLETANRARIEAELQNRILLEKSELDPLTKLANRFRLNDYSEQIFKRVSSAGESLAVEILDVDYFKEFNDNYGHQAGDECLVRVAAVLKEMASAHGAFCARYGGDEFVLIYEDVTKEQAASYAAELKQKIVSLEIEHKFSKTIPYVTVSQGLCWGQPKEDNRMWDFLHTADEMLYKVKTITRNNYCICGIAESDYTIGETENPSNPS